VEIFDEKLSQVQLNFVDKIADKLKIKADSPRRERTKKMIKISLVLSIMYRIIYRENQISIQDHISKFMNCVEDFLKKMSEGRITVDPNSQGNFVKTWDDCLNSSTFKPNSDNNIALSWKTVGYWLEHQGLILGERDRCHKHLAEVINKIIFFSNYYRKVR
jgi:hypothetical protein